jgi:chaperonin GroES
MAYLLNLGYLICLCKRNFDKINQHTSHYAHKPAFGTVAVQPLATYILSQTKINITMSLNIKPIGDRVVVEAAAAEEKTASGIFIPDTAKEKPQRGTIVAVGEGKKDEPLTVKVGDEILYGKYAGTEITYEGKEYLIMRESDVYAVL